MKSLFNDSVRQDILTRFDKLTDSSPRKWGNFTPAKLLAHCIDTFEVTFAEREVVVRKGFLNTPLGRWLIIDSPIPWPKGSPTDPEYLKGDPHEFAADKARVRGYIERFAKGSNQKFGPSPGLGYLTPDQWSRLHFRHMNHHLRQFGL